MKTLIAFLILSVVIVNINSKSQSLSSLRLAEKHSSLPEHFLANSITFKDTTEECDINLENSILLKDVKIVDAGDSVFTITKGGVDRSFGISQINSIKFIRHGFAKGMIYGVLASTAFWGVLGLATSHGSEGWNIGGYGFVIGFVLGIPTGLISGLISEFVTNDDVYDFGNANAPVKSKRLRYIISKHK